MYMYIYIYDVQNMSNVISIMLCMSSASYAHSLFFYSIFQSCIHEHLSDELSIQSPDI